MDFPGMKFIQSSFCPKPEIESEIQSEGGEITDSFDDLSKCGEIMVSGRGNFVFCCFWCSDRFMGIYDFINHMEMQHLKPFNRGVEANSEQRKVGQEVSQDSQESYSIISLDAPPPSLPVHSITTPGITRVKIEPEDSEDMNLPTEEVHIDDFPEDGTGVGVRKKHSQEDRPHACEICKARFYTPLGLAKHQKRHEITQDPNFTVEGDVANQDPEKLFLYTKSLKCKFCDRQFKDLGQRLYHETIHTGDTPFPCTMCDRSFRSERQRRDHISTHTDERPYKCPYCSSAFNHQTNLVVHVRIHLGDRPYPCDFCDKRFVRNVERQIHMRTHTGEKPYKCEQCDSRFSACSELTRHVNRRHLKIRDFGCEVCEKKFFSRSNLRDHMLEHSNERPFKCSSCPAAFPRKRGFITHEKIHSGIKEYSCKICGKGFAQNAGLYGHMKTHGLRGTKFTDEQLESFGEYSPTKKQTKRQKAAEKLKQSKASTGQVNIKIDPDSDIQMATETDVEISTEPNTVSDVKIPTKSNDAKICTEFKLSEGSTEFSDSNVPNTTFV